MLHTVRRLAVLAATFVAAPAALAQPGAYNGDDDQPPVYGPPAAPVAGTVVIVTPDQPMPPPQPQIQGNAPQNESWNDVSHINGTPVKVGERGDYLYKWKTTNIATNPLGWMFGVYGISVSHAVHDNVAVRVDANLFDITDRKGYEIGASLPIYFRRVFSGPFLEPGLIARDFGATCYDCSSDSTKADVGPEVLFGWHWTFDSGLNVAIAFGAMKPMNSTSMHSKETQPAGYFRIGYAF